MKVGVASKLMIGSSLLAPTQSGTFNFRRLSSINCVLSTGGLANVIFGTLPSDILKSCIQLFQHVSLFFKTIKIDITSTNSQEKIDFQGNVLSEPGGENDFARYKPRLRVSRLRGVVIVIIWAKSMAWGVRSMPMILIKLPPVSLRPDTGPSQSNKRRKISQLIHPFSL